MMQGQKLDLALPFAERMLKQIENNNLERWEPDLALSALLVIYRCFQMKTDGKNDEEIHSLLNRITLLAPEKTINLI